MLDHEIHSKFFEQYCIQLELVHVAQEGCPHDYELSHSFLDRKDRARKWIIMGKGNWNSPITDYQGVEDPKELEYLRIDRLSSQQWTRSTQRSSQRGQGQRKSQKDSF